MNRIRLTGGTSCQVWCIYDAISFPDPDYVKSLIKKRGVLKQAEKQLKEKMENGENITVYARQQADSE